MNNTNNQNEAFYKIETYAEDNIDSHVLYDLIHKEYPSFNHDENDIAIKRLFITIIENKKFMKHIFKTMNGNIQEFIKMIYKDYGYIFSSYYTHKITAVLKKMNYD